MFLCCGNTGNIPGDGDGTDTTSTDDPNDNDGTRQRKRIVYHIDDILVEEGEFAQFTVTRTGYTESSSSVKYRTLKYKGSAKEQEDYIPVNDILGFAPGETEKTITIRTVQSVEREADEDFYIILRKNTPMLGSDVQTTFDKNIGICTITEGRLFEPRDPYRGNIKNPYEYKDTFTDDVIKVVDQTEFDQEVPDPDLVQIQMVMVWMMILEMKSFRL